jgi:hypothetical protein
MDANQVRASLDIAFPHYVSIDAKMVGNLRRKALQVIAQGIDPNDIDPISYLRHSRVGPVAAEQSTEFDTDTIRQTSDKKIWSALARCHEKL